MQDLFLFPQCNCEQELLTFLKPPEPLVFMYAISAIIIIAEYICKICYSCFVWEVSFFYVKKTV